ncbi:MAG TPA: DUF3857 and transglutaminase domain-containing protein [Acidobacteriota bacterium]|nr:DUF3857 and transglutaminase domain-containing protein [Acidobacteriota bacterium]
MLPSLLFLDLRPSHPAISSCEEGSGALPARLLVLVHVLCLALSPAVEAADWKPVDPADLRAEQPSVEAGADAEALFWEVRVQDEVSGQVPKSHLDHYLRLKIFTERGVEQFGTVRLGQSKDIRILAIRGRTIQPDGSVIELDGDSVFEQDSAKGFGVTLTDKTFVMPAVKPGAIIEYQWRETRLEQFAHGAEFDLQREFPVRRVTYYLKPWSNDQGYDMRALVFNAEQPPFQHEPGGWQSVSLENVAAFREEPHMPPGLAVRPWMLTYYTRDHQDLSPQEYWKRHAKRLWDVHKKRFKVNRAVRDKTAELLEGVKSPQEKLRILYDFCRREIENIHDDTADLSQRELEERDANKKPEDTLEEGRGTGYDITMLFLALGEAAGFEARPAAVGNSAFFFFDPQVAVSYLLPNMTAAVQVGQEWRFFHPPARYAPFGTLPWFHEGQLALIADPDEPAFVRTPVSSPQRSFTRRSADLSLDEEGTLEGHIRIEFGGHQGARRREIHDASEESERRDALLEMLAGRLPGIEVSAPAMERIGGPGSLVYTARIRLPGFAQVTGKRLFLQPAFFQQGQNPRFTAAERLHPIYFHHTWMDEDIVRIKLPEGYEASSLESPGSFRAPEVCEYMVSLAMEADNTLVYKRRFIFKGLLFPAESYSSLKDVFDMVHTRDSHTLILRHPERN